MALGYPRALLITSPLQFQGEWNAIGWAQNTFVSESISDVNMVSTKFELNKDHSYSVTSVWFR